MSNLIGEKFGKLTVIENLGSFNKRIYWLCECACGEYTTTYTAALNAGKKKSCGCLKNIPWTKTHGMSKTPEYVAWCRIKIRCYNKNNDRYSDYGGRGITMCDRWIDSFDAFFKDMGKRPSKFHSIDRIDNNGNYSPNNCRWATEFEQSNNRRNNYVVEINGEIKNLSEWCRIYGVLFSTVKNRIHKGWPIIKALETTPKKPFIYSIEINGESNNLKQWCRIYNIHYSTVRGRIASGWDAVRAITTPLLR